MGLDITAYGLCVLVTPAHEYDEDERDCYSRGHVAPYRNPDFPGHLDTLDPVCHTAAREVQFRAGSYSGYNWWRAALCRFAFNVKPEVVWHDFPTYSGKPFAELIHFSDCEGSIGPRTSAKLANDFAEWEAAAVEYARTISDGDSWLLKYRQWREAFELAAAGGFLDFH